jgi:glycosyltransferase involved in cell wall biosynthesis
MTEPVRHVVVLNDFSVTRGGASGLAILAARLLRARGLRVTFISGDSGEGATLREQGIEHIALNGPLLTPEQSPLSALRALWNTSLERRIKALVAELDTPHTVYHLHGWQKIFSPSVFSALREVRERLLLHAHDYFLVCPNGTFMEFPKRQVCHRKPLSPPCLVTNCDRRRALHKVYRIVRHAVQDRASGLPLDPVANILLIHPAMRADFARAGVPDHRMFALLNPATPFCAERVPAEKNRTFFFVGRIEPEKGPREFALAARQAGVQACIVGDGSLSAEIRRDFPEIRMITWCDRAELSSHVASARCLVMPSQLPEPFGLVAAEAAQSGIPVLATEHAFLAGDLQRMGAGLAVSTETAAFARALERVDRDDDLVLRMSLNGFAHGKALSTTPDSWCDELVDHFRRLLAQSAKPPRKPDESPIAQRQI